MQQNTVPSSGIYWNSSSRTHEDFLVTIRDYTSKDCLMDVLQETRRNKIEEVTRFCHKLIRYVREFIDDKATTPTFLLRKLIKDLDKNDKIFALKTKMDFIGDIVNLLYDIRVSHIEHLSSIHARTFLEVILN